MKTINIRKTRPDALLPTRAKPGDSGLDLYALDTGAIPPRDRGLLSTGIAIELEPGFEAQVRPRSGMSIKQGVVAAFGTVDSGYRGEVKVTLINHDSVNWFHYKTGDRVAQLVIAPVSYPEPVEVAELSDTERGTSGFGSTGA